MSFFSTFDQTQLFLNKEVPSDAKAVAVIVHGLCEHQGRYDYFASLFHGQGIGTYRFDHRGHGQSQGERAHLSDWNELVDDTNMVVDMAISENPDIPVFLIGHSMGGFTVALYCAKYPDKKLKGVVASGALVQDFAGLIRAVPDGLDPHMQLPNELGAGVCSVAEVVEWYGQDPLNGKVFTTGLCYAIKEGMDWFVENSQNIAYPFLVVHGEKDGLVSPKDGQYLFENIASKDRQIKIYGNLFHEIFNEYCKDEVIGDVLNWIGRRM
ncbi:alpha/beta hydrolase [Bengtsoniella intestinalis]|uniref:alpha/beta hydrolase n=1 Tax=Bengtsoniella intestinalis TaxID=3073143 RepID=UPI00391F7B0C